MRRDDTASGRGTPRTRRPDSALRIGALLAVVAFVMGCGAVLRHRNDEPVQSYMFAPREFAPMLEVDSDAILLVAPVQSVGYDHMQMTYAMRPYERTYYAFSRWADTPPRMIEPLIVQAMEASGLFQAVVDVASSVPADYRLDVELLVLQHEFHTSPSQGRMVLRAQLNDIDGNEILGTRIFQATAPAPSENPYGGVLALNLALESILEDMAQWVIDALGPRLDARVSAGATP